MRGIGKITRATANACMTVTVCSDLALELVPGEPDGHPWVQIHRTVYFYGFFFLICLFLLVNLNAYAYFRAFIKTNVTGTTLTFSAEFF